MSEAESPAKASLGRKVGIGCGGLLVLMVLVTIIFGPSDEEMAEIEAERIATEQTEREEAAQAAMDSATAVTAGELFAAYSQNEVAAQRAYGDRALLVSGVIDDVTLDFMDEPVVSLRTSNEFMSVQLDFDEGDMDQIASLQSGMTVQALCNELSEIAGTPMLDDCVLQSAN